MSNFSPGPYRTVPAYRDLYIDDARGRSIALVCTVDDSQAEEGITKEATGALLASAPDLYAAAEAALQCITDFLEVYKRGGSMLVMDEAVKSLRDDALRLTRAALAKADGGKA